MNIVIEKPVLDYLAKKNRTVMTLGIQTVGGG
jgi:hypothetical protein